MSHAYSGDYNSKEMIGQKPIGVLSLNLVRHSMDLIRMLTLKHQTFSQIDLKMLDCDNLFCISITFRI